MSESGASTQSAAPQHHTSFLQNKALSGTVFGLAGLVGLVLIVVLITFALRRRRRSRLLDDAVSFDPGLVDRYDGSEKGHSSNPSLGTVGSAPYGGPVAGYGTYNPEPVQQHSYGGPQQAYYGGPQQPEYYGAPQNAQQPYYSPYVPPMADAPPTTSLANPSRGTHNIPRVPVPAKPLPAEFGSSDQDNRLSVEESEFWAKTLKVTND